MNKGGDCDFKLLHESTTAGSDCAAQAAHSAQVQDPGQGTALGICAALCRRKIQKFGVHAALSRVFIGKQRVPPCGCSPSRDTLSLQGQEYSGEAAGVKRRSSKSRRTAVKPLEYQDK